MKKFFKNLPPILFILSVPVYADTQGEAANVNLADVLVSALYFVGVLALIYLILSLVSRWGKKHPDQKDADPNPTEKPKNNAETSAETITPKSDENKTDLR